MEDLENTPNPVRSFILELALVMFVLVLMVLAGVLVFDSLRNDLNLNSSTQGTELFKQCQSLYLEDVYNQDTLEIDSVKLNKFYTQYKDCKIFNVTDLDPQFQKDFFKSTE